MEFSSLVREALQRENPQALKGLVACNAPSWTIHDIDADAKDTVVIPGDLLATSSGAVWHLLQILGASCDT